MTLQSDREFTEFLNASALKISDLIQESYPKNTLDLIIGNRSLMQCKGVVESINIVRKTFIEQNKQKEEKKNETRDLDSDWTPSQDDFSKSEESFLTTKLSANFDKFTESLVKEMIQTIDFAFDNNEFKRERCHPALQKLQGIVNTVILLVHNLK